MDNLIFNRCEAKTAREIESLEQRRAAIFEVLEGVYTALQPLLERKPDLADLEDFLSLKDPAAAEIRAFEVWLSHPGRNPMNIRPAAARSALPQYPEAIRDLVAAFEAYHAAPRSQEWRKYWSAAGQAFRAMPVTKAEREAIATRNVISYRDEQAKEQLNFVRIACDLINRQVGDNSIPDPTPAEFSVGGPSRYPVWLRGFVIHDNNGRFEKFTVRPDVAAFCRCDVGEPLFEEEAVISPLFPYRRKKGVATTAPQLS
jgi:hypothetical protein